jgi:hypothetical protein
MHFNIITHSVPGFQSDIFLRVFFFKILIFRMHATHPSRSAQRNHAATWSAPIHCALRTRHVPADPFPYKTRRKSSFNLHRLPADVYVTYKRVLFAELHLYQSNFLHQSHINSHRITWNWGFDDCKDMPSSGLLYRSLNATVAQPQTCHFDLTPRFNYIRQHRHTC